MINDRNDDMCIHTEARNFLPAPNCLTLGRLTDDGANTRAATLFSLTAASAQTRLQRQFANYPLLLVSGETFRNRAENFRLIA